MGIREVEVDTQLTRDNVVVLCHDDNLERYANGDQVVEEMTSQMLLSLDMGSWFSPSQFAGISMLTLEDLLDDFSSDFAFHIELKGAAPDLPIYVFDLLERHGVIDHCIVTSFSFDHLVRMRELTTCRLGWLVEEFSKEVLSRAKELELFQLCPPARKVNAQLVELGRGAVKEIRVWGMSGAPSEVRSMVKRAVDCGCDGMTINWPDWAVHSKN